MFGMELLHADYVIGSISYFYSCNCSSRTKIYTYYLPFVKNSSDKCKPTDADTIPSCQDPLPGLGQYRYFSYCTLRVAQTSV